MIFGPGNVSKITANTCNHDYQHVRGHHLLQRIGYLLSSQLLRILTVLHVRRQCLTTTQLGFTALKDVGMISL